MKRFIAFIIAAMLMLSFAACAQEETVITEEDVALYKEMLVNFPDLEFVTIQGETYGEGIQKRDYHMKEHCFMAFNFIMGMIDKNEKIYSHIKKNTNVFRCWRK